MPDEDADVIYLKVTIPSSVFSSHSHAYRRAVGYDCARHLSTKLTAEGLPNEVEILGGPPGPPQAEVDDDLGVGPALR